MKTESTLQNQFQVYEFTKFLFDFDVNIYKSNLDGTEYYCISSNHSIYYGKGKTIELAIRSFIDMVIEYDYKYLSKEQASKLKQLLD